MRLVDGKVRIMREELAKAENPKDTDEIRETYDLDYFRSNLTYHVREEVQNRHMHLLLYGAHHVLDGLMEIQDDDGNWHQLQRRQAAVYKPGEFYNARVLSNTPQVSYPDAGSTIGAVSIFYKWLPPNLEVHENEAQFIFNNDWFGEGFLKDPIDKKSSPALRLAEAEQKRFWEIVKRNREKLSSNWTRFNLQLYLE